MSSVTELLMQLQPNHPMTTDISYDPFLLWCSLAVLSAVLASGLLRYVLYPRLLFYQKKQRYLQTIYRYILDYKRTRNTEQLVTRCNSLLQSIAQHDHHHDYPHLLYHKAWLQWLNQTGHTTLFTEGVGAILGTYQKDRHLKPHEPLQLYHLLRQWICKVYRYD